MALIPTARGSIGSIVMRSGKAPRGRTVHFPRSCLHCETPDCVTVCPTGASYKREEDGIVLVNPDTCIGCKLCSWACPYGAREYDYADGVMKKCTLCVDRIYNENLDPLDRVPACVRACPTGARHFGDLGDPESAVSELVRERGGYDLLPETGYRPVNKYLPPREARNVQAPTPADASPSRLEKQDQVRIASSPGPIRSCRGRRGNEMHPAYSVILFTTASGAGYGLLSMLSIRRSVWGSFRSIHGSALPVSCCRFRADNGRLAVIDLPSRTSREVMAGFLTVANLLAVARRRRRSCHLCSFGALSRSDGSSARQSIGHGRRSVGSESVAQHSPSIARA